MFVGIQIIEDKNMVDYVEDWSGVRSRGRAERRRRRKRGFQQRIKITAVPKKEAYQFQGKVIMHPEMARELRGRIAEQNP